MKKKSKKRGIGKRIGEKLNNLPAIHQHLLAATLAESIVLGAQGIHTHYTVAHTPIPPKSAQNFEGISRDVRTLLGKQRNLPENVAVLYATNSSAKHQETLGMLRNGNRRGMLFVLETPEDPEKVQRPSIKENGFFDISHEKSSLNTAYVLTRDGTSYPIEPCPEESGENTWCITHNPGDTGVQQAERIVDQTAAQIDAQLQESHSPS